MRSAAWLALLCVVGCGVEPQPRTQAIIGGVPTQGDPAVVMLEVGVGTCTAALVRPNVLLTAAHCVDSGSSIVARIGGSPIAVVEAVVPRQYVSFEHHDVALVRLEREVSIAPAELNTVPFEGDVGSVRVVGFGADQPQMGTVGAGTKRTVVAELFDVTGEHLLFGNDVANICTGDSGGPTLVSIEGREVITGVVSTTTTGCLGTSRATRVDVYAMGFIEPVLSTWYGPCAADGQCDPGAVCAYPDPDCDPCGFDGTCEAGCARPDLDCPLGAGPGERCAVDVDCESRACVADDRDARATYCSAPCAQDRDCVEPLSTCEAGFCGYDGPAPGTQGAMCVLDEQCLGGSCDAEDGACVDPCTTTTDCLAGFACRGDVCVAADGGCSTGGRGAPVALLLIALLACRRRNG